MNEQNPKHFDLLLTGSCMLRCKMCYLWENKPALGSLELDEWKEIIESIKCPEGCGKTTLHFGGGEPFMSSLVLPLIQFASRNNIVTMSTSNGYLFDKRLCSRVLSSGLGHISFSLDSLNDKMHDYLRGVNGAYSRVMSGIKYLSSAKQKLTIGINCIISALNLDSILPLARWVINNEQISGIMFQAIIQPHNKPQDNLWYEKSEFSELWPQDKISVEKVLDGLIELKKSSQGKLSNSILQLEAFKNYFNNPSRFLQETHCPMNSNSFTINWEGNVYICGLLQNMGNIRSADIKDILNSSLMLEVVKEMKLCKRNCNNKVNCYFEGKIVTGNNK